MTRTSITHPLQIADIATGPGQGRIGVTFCPGKKQLNAATGAWDRDLGLDIQRIADWGAVAVLTLIENQEIRTLKVEGLGGAVRARHMDWLHLPITDVSTPDHRFEAAWQSIGENLRDRFYLDTGSNTLLAIPSPGRTSRLTLTYSF